MVGGYNIASRPAQGELQLWVAPDPDFLAVELAAGSGSQFG
jgi:hypothetical protein